MSAVLRRALGAGIAVAALFGLGALSRAPYTADGARHAVLRLTWRARGEQVEECRRLTPEELERLPVHMRQEERCEGRVPPYRLRVSLDGVRAVDELVRAAGARHDRPLYVFRELTLEPGSHVLVVRFARDGETPTGARRPSEEDREEATTPARLVLDTVVTLAARRVLLVTYDEEGRRLVVRYAPTR
ncbi:MAG TPA: hypothetical protein VFU41_15580 [Gemmatimonadales bacterium]|nr:hypothetical protein [Gemmatimonadales bacterium]